ncbi:allantoinase AllB [Ornithinimicrobium panacihumi]|uniref:allantoinase AllB n=1 Tax=Ornithinimicrobium panacihumi TaxID=2008449 RepID=UPI003F8BEC17
MTLDPGDLVLTGTPAGVAVARPYLRPGQVVSAHGTGLGRQTNHVEAREGTMDPMNNDTPELDLVVRASRAVVDGAERAVTVGVKDGRIVAVEDIDADLRAATVVELAEDEVLLPGLVDTHVHVNEPGRTEWEGFESATRAAAAGGVTTIIDMPLNSIPSTVTVAALREKQAVARDQVFVDVGFWGGAVPDHLGDIEDLHEAGVFGFKCFLADSGVDEFPHLEPEQFAEAMDQTARVGALMIVHAEDSAALAACTPANGATYSGFLASRSTDAEDIAVGRVVEETRRTGGRSHVLHLSAAAALPALRAAREEGLDLSVETCPHYLTLTAEEIPDGATQFKCCPPIREQANQDKLWAGLTAGDIDIVVSDHSPSTADLKHFDTGDFGTAWGGIASVQLGLSAVWSEARARRIPLTEVVRWMATGPADRVGLTHKGRIEVGADADLVVFAPEEEWDVDVQALKHKNPVSAYADRHLHGNVRQTWLRGTQITEESRPTGRLLERGQR